MEQWKNETLQIDSAKNHLKTLRRIKESFLTSHYADDITERTKALMLLKRIKKLFK